MSVQDEMRPTAGRFPVITGLVPVIQSGLSVFACHADGTVALRHGRAAAWIAGMKPAMTKAVEARP